MMAYFEEAESEVRMDLKDFALNLGMGTFAGCAGVVIVPGGIALVFT